MGGSGPFMASTTRPSTTAAITATSPYWAGESLRSVLEFRVKSKNDMAWTISNRSDPDYRESLEAVTTARRGTGVGQGRPAPTKSAARPRGRGPSGPLA